MIRRVMMISMIASAIGVPYIVTSASGWWRSAKSSFTSSTSEPADPAAVNVQAAASAPQARTMFDDREVPTLAATKKLPPVEGYGAHDLSEVFNFNGSPGWVMSRWPRVTVGLAELDMQGYRVPLVTGTAQDDLAGSLTYYFDDKQHVKLIHFRGTTGNPHKLVSLVMSRYGLKPQATPDPSMQLYQLKWNGKPVSELQVRTARVVRAAQPYTRCQVELALKRP